MDTGDGENDRTVMDLRGEFDLWKVWRQREKEDDQRGQEEHCRSRFLVDDGEKEEGFKQKWTERDREKRAAIKIRKANISDGVIVEPYRTRLPGNSILLNFILAFFFFLY